MNAHVINKQVIDLKVSSKENAFRIQQLVRELYHNKVLPLLDKMMTRISPGEKILQIERLELDLGELNFEKMDKEMMEALRPQIEEQLKSLLRHAEQIPESEIDIVNDGIAEIKTGEQSSLELVKIFLSTGLLPWWMPDIQETFDIDKLLLELLEKQPVSLLAALSELSSVPVSARRMIQQVSRKNHLRIMAELPSWITGEIKQLWKEVLSLETLKANSFFEKETEYVLFLAPLIANAPEPGKLLKQAAIVKALVKAVAFVTNKEIIQVTHLFYKEVLRQVVASKKKNSSDTPLILYFSAWEKEFPSESAKVSGSPLLTISAVTERSDRRTAKENDELEEIITRFLENQSGKVTPSSKKTGRQETKENAAGKKIIHNENNLSSGEQTAFKNKIEDLLSAIQDKSARDEDLFFPESSPPAGITRYGGLILVAPFLPAFFRELRLTADDQFPGEAEKHKAIHLLNYLATGKTKASEHTLMLHKLLCGVEITEPVPKSVKLSVPEKKEAMIFLSDIAEQWTTLRTSSGEVLRNTFMKRDGIIENREGAWLLRIERGAVDVMLDTLPWTISIIRAPWMQQFLHVEW